MGGVESRRARREGIQVGAKGGDTVSSSRESRARTRASRTPPSAQLQRHLGVEVDGSGSGLTGSGDFHFA